jgi:hypothetical protein
VDKIIVTVMLIIGGIVASFAVFNGIYPAVERSGEAITSASDAMNDRIRSDIQIIQVNDNTTAIDAWVKNVGTSDVTGVENSDIFFGLSGSYERIPYGSESSPLPYWSYDLEGTESVWRPSGTNKITINLDSSPPPGTYVLKVIIPNGIFDETVFGVE